MPERPAMSSRQWWTLVLVCTATFMLLDITVVSVALPSIQRDLRASLPDLQWVIDAYALVLAVLLLPAATLGDRLGRRRLFLAGLAVFTAGSLACALAPTALTLELFRAVQGVGGAVLFATGTPLLRAEFSGVTLARALGVFGATIRCSIDTPLSEEQVRAALTDFSARRPQLFPSLDPGLYQVHDRGPTWADVTEGSRFGGGIWERGRYDWADPHPGAPSRHRVQHVRARRQLGLRHHTWDGRRHARGACGEPARPHPLETASGGGAAGERAKGLLR